MNQGKDIIVNWYVIFTKSTLKHWLFKYLDEEIQHCYMVKRDCGLWVIIDTSNSCISVRTEIIDEYPHIRDLCPNSVILPVRAKIDCSQYRWHLGIASCVDVCKGFLGINQWRIITPYQLYRWLNERQ